MNVLSPQTVDIAHLIQVALTPIFLISAIGVILSVLTSRLARIVDRARNMESRLRGESESATDSPGDDQSLQLMLQVLARRARHINLAITLITISALLISLVVVMLFVNAFLRWDLSAFIAISFILSMASLGAALSSFLVEVRIATNALRIGIDAASRQRGA
jgi:hypothetical protein